MLPQVPQGFFIGPVRPSDSSPVKPPQSPRARTRLRKVATSLIAGAALFTTNASSTAFAQSPPPPIAPSPPQRWVKTTGNDREFYGTWNGKWKNTYTMRFTIGPDANGESGKFSVLYECQPHRDSPLQQQQVVGRLEGGALVIGKITLFLLEEPDCLLVHGNYRHQPMITEVVREKTR